MRWARANPVSQFPQEPADYYNVSVANRLYTANGFHLDSQFRKFSKAVLNIQVAQVDFSDGLSTSESINSWVRNQTNGRIDQLVSPGEIHPSVRCMKT